MDHKERFYATIERRPVDRPCTWLGIPDPASLPNLFKYFDVQNINELVTKLDDDIVTVGLPYHSPVSDAIYEAFDFAKRGKISREHRTLNAPGFFEDIHDPDRLNEFDWPEPEKYVDPDECRAIVESVPQDKAILGVLWSCHFQDTCAAFGMQTAFLKMYDAPELVGAIAAKITDFYLRANEIFYQATKDKLDAILIGNDFGTQLGLMLSPDMIREYAFPGTRQLVDQAKSHGLKVIHHSCGSIRDIIPDLIEMGVDAIHPVQVLAHGMDPRELKEAFGDKLSLCGAVDVQDLMVNGTAEEVKTRVRELIELFPTGLIVSLSHEALLPDVPPANVAAMFEAVHGNGIARGKNRW